MCRVTVLETDASAQSPWPTLRQFRGKHNHSGFWFRAYICETMARTCCRRLGIFIVNSYLTTGILFKRLTCLNSVNTIVVWATLAPIPGIICSRFEISTEVSDQQFPGNCWPTVAPGRARTLLVSQLSSYLLTEPHCHPHH